MTDDTPILDALRDLSISLDQHNLPHREDERRITVIFDDPGGQVQAAMGKELQPIALLAVDPPQRDIILHHGVEVRFRGRTSIDIPVVWDINAMGNWYMRPKR